MVYDQSTSGSIVNVSDAADFTLSLETGQTLAIICSPATPTLRPALAVLGPGGNVLASSSAAADGQDVVVQSFPVLTPGTYTIRVSGASGTTGTFKAQAVLNAAIESEEHSGPTNDTTATAQNLDSAFTTIGQAASRVAVEGILMPAVGPTSDFYAVTLSAGDSIGVAIARQGGGNEDITVLDDSSNVLRSEDFILSANVDVAVPSLVVAASGTYYVRVQGSGVERYNLLITRNAVADNGDNGTAATATEIDGANVIVGAVRPDRRLFGVQVNQNDTSIYEVNARTGASIHFYRSPLFAGGVNSAGYGVASTPTSLLIGNQSIQPISEWDIETHTVIRTIPNPGIKITGMAFLNGRIYVLSEPTSTITVLDYPSGTVLGSFNAIPDQGLAASDTALFGASTGGSAGNNLYRIDPNNPTHPIFVGVLPATATLVGMGMLGTELFASDGKQVFVYDINTLALLRTFKNWVMVGIADGNIFGPPDDYYSLTLTAGQSVTFRTATPGAASGLFDNTLDPALELLDPSGASVATDDNGAPDGRNAVLTFTPSQSGVYKLRIYGAANSTGEYVVTTDLPRTTVATPATPNLLDSSDTGTSATDNITNRNNSDPSTSLQFSITNTTIGATVTLYAAPAGTTNFVPIGGAVATGLTTVVTTDGSTVLADAPFYVIARESIGAVQSIDSKHLSLQIDTTPPVAPPGPDLQNASDTGQSFRDNVTNATTLSFTVPANTFFRFYVEGAQVSADVETGTVFTVASQSDGVHSYQLAFGDTAGNISALGPALNVTVDTVAPAAPTAPDLDAASDTGGNNTDNITNASRQEFTFANPEPYFSLYIDGMFRGSAYNAGNTFTSLPSAGTSSYQVGALDAAGNASPLSPAAVVTTVTASTGAAFDMTGPPGTQVFSVTAGTVTVASDLSLAYPGISFTVSNGATASFASAQHFSTLTVAGGATATAAGGALIVGTLSIDGTSALDLQTSDLLADRSLTPASTIRSYLTSGYANNAWNGSGIRSTTAAGDPTHFSLGYADGGVNSDAPPGQVLVRYTRRGDANLDRKVDIQDLLRFRANAGTPTPAQWWQADFTYDGKVDIQDLLAFRANAGTSAPEVVAAASSAYSPLLASATPSINDTDRDRPILP